MRIRCKTDDIPIPFHCGRSWFEYGSQIYSDTNFVYPPSTAPGLRPVRVDRCEDELHSGPPYRSGGPLDIRHFRTDEYDLEPSNQKISSPFDWYYEGGFLPSESPSKYLDWTDPTSSSLDDCQWVDPDILVDGANGWNKAKPATSNAEALVSLGEAHEIPEMLRQTAKNYHHIWKDSGGNRRTFGPKDLADNWLNTQFGWLPFLNDMAALYDTTKNQEKHLNQLRRDNKQWKYARRTVRKEASEELVYENYNSSGSWPVLTSYFYNSPYGHARISKRTVLDVWFVGRFRYYIPFLKTKGPASMWEMAQLYGLMPSPTAVYELTPWSWLIDWVTNFGKITDNIWSIIAEGVCSKYAYVMAHKNQTATFEGFTNFKDKPLTIIRSATCDQKVRRPADPFGFGLNPASFSTRQWSILAALGMSKNRILGA